MSLSPIIKNVSKTQDTVIKTIGPLTTKPDAFPWQPRPAGSSDVVWRYRDNPLISRNHVKNAGGIYNSAVMRTETGYTGIFRVDSNTGVPFLHFGTSPDGLKWVIEQERLKFTTQPNAPGVDEFAYDPRLCRIENTWYITWCNGYHGPTVGLASTTDFKEFKQHENAFLPYNRNGVMFPKRINGNFAMLSRPSDNGHTPFGDIFYSESPDLCFWGKHRFVMGPTTNWWEGKKIGAGPVPIETRHGWLLIYHGVMSTCNGFVYSMGAALLDLEEPWKVIRRCSEYLLTPEAQYEISGLVPNVIFPCAALHDRATGRLAIYYGAADTHTCVAFTHLDELVGFIENNSV